MATDLERRLFLELAAKPHIPNRIQQETLDSFLRWLEEQAIFSAGRGAGKTTIRKWLIRLLIAEEYAESRGFNQWVLLTTGQQSQVDYKEELERLLVALRAMKVSGPAIRDAEAALLVN